MKITDLFGKKIIICDGAMGTMLQQYGLKAGEIPEMLNYTHPEIIEDIHRAYYEAGSDLVSTNTFGCNRLKLEKTGYTVDQIVSRSVQLARSAAAMVKNTAGDPDKDSYSDKFVALDIGPIGKLMEPAGDMSFDEAYDIYKELIIAGSRVGVDVIFFETFTDIYELKSAVLAAKENCDLPVFCSVTFQEDGRMLMGTDPLTAINIIQDLGIDAIGVNCSLGPKQMTGIVREFLKYSGLPVLVQPNAGLPSIVDGETVYQVNITEYVEAMQEMIRDGIAIAGGCCGTSPEYIAALTKSIQSQEYTSPAIESDKQGRRKSLTAASSAMKTVMIDDRIRVIGERINPTGKKLLKEALKAKDFSYLENEAIEQVKAGADILDINVGLPEIDEYEVMLTAVKKVSSVVNAPLQIDSADPKVIEAAVRHYNGKPIINSVNGKKESMETIFPIVKKYGTCVIALTLDEKGLPENTEERLTIAERIIKTAETYGIDAERIIVDCLTLTVSAQQEAGRDTLEAIRRVKQQFGVKTTLGASNVSFGLPERKLLNRTFLGMALAAGLDAPITDPLVPEYMDTIRAFEALSGKDKESNDYIRFYGGQVNQVAGKTPDAKTKANITASAKKAELTLKEIILEGFEDRAAEATEKLLKEMKPLDIVEKTIIPALEIVGKEYESGNSFLPQLIKSAETVKAAFSVLKEAMKSTGGMVSYGKVILATVQGDIHDIGKNIVKVLLENYGYEVVDLGKDVPIEDVVEAAKNQNIKMVGLSALMTTTVVNMEKTIKALKEAGLDCVTMVGGAVLNKEYAKKIGADFYCKDAMEAVRTANRVFKEG
ncbi:MAG: homocysteine S-methyltransferase family protein [Eubacteriales bacterium]|nr:homocysteine S-methyltransferase family protein [Eubacteriales bacterium]MDD3199157.1 homocysteine S-methyltransferase family protein [Eubacteriales bacterium]MDD4629188.1 homocysteine S-methyltransferase family protein [Eubacteriales bacterium]